MENIRSRFVNAADAMAKNSHAYTVVGGGDSVSATNMAGVADKMIMYLLVVVLH